MTLTAEQSSNKARYEAAPTAEIIDIIRTAMGQGCIRPCHVYDAVDELICRIQALENRPKRNCDVGTPKEQAERFDAFCQSNMQFHRDMFSHDDEGRLDGWDCREDCPVGRMIDSGTAVADHCQLAWAQMPYVEKEGGAE